MGNRADCRTNPVRQLKNILPAEEETHKTLVSYLVAFSWSLKHQLRKTDPAVDLYRLLPKEKWRKFSPAQCRLTEYYY